MSDLWQNLLALAVVVAVVTWFVRAQLRARRRTTNGGAGCSTGCGSCGTPGQGCGSDVPASSSLSRR